MWAWSIVDANVLWSIGAVCLFQLLHKNYVYLYVVGGVCKKYVGSDTRRNSQ